MAVSDVALSPEPHERRKSVWYFPPFFWPDVKSFLAISVVLAIVAIVLLLLLRPIDLSDRQASILNILLGIMIGSYKDVYNHFFSSTKTEEEKSKTIAQQSAALATSAPAAIPVVTTTTTEVPEGTTTTTTAPSTVVEPKTGG